MVDSIGIQQQAVVKKDNTKRNTAIATGIGAIGGGATGYLTKSIIKNGELTDEFVKGLEDETLKSASDANKEDYKALKYIIKMEENPSSETLKKFVTKHAKFLELNSEELEEVLTSIDEDATEFVNSKIKPIKEDYKNTLGELKEIVQNNYDPETKTFKLKEEGLQILNRVKRSIKGKSALIWGGASAVALGFSTWVLSKVMGNKENSK